MAVHASLLFEELFVLHEVLDVLRLEAVDADHAVEDLDFHLEDWKLLKVSLIIVGALKAIQVKLWVAAAEEVRDHEEVVRPDEHLHFVDLAFNLLLAIRRPVELE